MVAWKTGVATPRRGIKVVRVLFSNRRLFAMVSLVAALGLLACSTSRAAGTGSGARGVQSPPKAVAGVPSTTPTIPVSGLPAITFAPRTGDAVTMHVEMADTEALRECGLMNRSSMPDDHGMIFTFTEPVDVPFWMKDTLIDLSVAFVASNGTIVDIQEMKAQSLDSHYPAKPYQFAIEANATWYARNGIVAGDTVDLSQALAATGMLDSCQLTRTATP
jgi:uncharacterized membrane protein (UPF0127 family)